MGVRKADAELKSYSNLMTESSLLLTSVKLLLLPEMLWQMTKKLLSPCPPVENVVFLLHSSNLAKLLLLSWLKMLDLTLSLMLARATCSGRETFLLQLLPIWKVLLPKISRVILERSSMIFTRLLTLCLVICLRGITRREPSTGLPLRLSCESCLLL